MIMMNSFGEMVDRRKALSLVYSQDRCQTFSPPQISDTPHTGFHHAQSFKSRLCSMKTCGSYNQYTTTAPPHLYCSWIIKRFVSKLDFITLGNEC